MLLLKVASFFLALVLSCEASPRRDSVDGGVGAASNSAKRLSSDVTPQSYALELSLPKKFETNHNFFGQVTINLTIGKTLESFPIHFSSSLTLDGDVSLMKDDNNITITTELDESNDFLLINGDNSTLKNGNYTLKISYIGKLSNTSMEGFYLSSYTDENGETKYLATTQFEQFGARKGFPCFDEPALKATFDIAISYPNGYYAYSNAVGTTGDPSAFYTTTTFKSTPEMSTYLVAFIVADFSCKYGGSSSSSIRPSVCARLEAQTSNTTALAVQTAPQVLDLMKDYTGFDYYNMDVKQLTLVAVPDFAAGAMENWGLVTYREADLLYHEKQSSDSFAQTVVTVVAHELSHQWFGDLVTLEWWSDIFLNEGFATYFEYYIPDLIYSEWELPKQFVVKELQTALVTDSLDTSLPLSYNTSDLQLIIYRFDDISYNKGGSILRMVHHLLDIENFKAGLKKYIDENKFSTATPDILWTALEKAIPKNGVSLPTNVTFSEVMENWTKKPGYPLLNVTADGDDVIISQKQFLLSGESNTTWYVPVTYSQEGSNFSDTSTKTWVVPDNETVLKEVLEKKKWIILNNQQTGYYRVQYDTSILSAISEALREDPEVIDEINRSQLVDDQMNLARAGIIDYTDALDFLIFLQNDTSYYSWYSALTNFDYLLRRVNDEKVQTALEAYIAKLIKNLVASVELKDVQPNEQIQILKQVLALTWACRLKDETCIKYSTSNLKNYATNQSKSIDKNLKSIVYCYGLRNSDNPVRDFDFLWKAYRKTQLSTERVTILQALGCVNDAVHRKTYLEYIFSDDIRIQDARYVFSSVASSGPEGNNNLIDFLQSNSQKLISHFGEYTAGINYAISQAANNIKSQVQLDLLRKLSSAFPDHGSSIEAAAKTAEANLKFTESLETTLKAYFDQSNNSASPNNYHFLNLIFVLVGYVIFNF